MAVAWMIKTDRFGLNRNKSLLNGGQYKTKPEHTPCHALKVLKVRA